MDLDSCVLRLSAELMSRLAQTGQMTIPEVESVLEELAGDSGRVNLLPTLSFLYLIGRIEYRKGLDSVSLLGTEEPF